MALPLTPETLAAAYDLLCTTPPFNKWNLPDHEDVTFKVTKSKDYIAACRRSDKGNYLIEVSSSYVGRTAYLLETMAHEMIHVHEVGTGICKSGRSDHGVSFKKFAGQVCEIHGFDPKVF